MKKRELAMAALGWASLCTAALALSPPALAEQPNAAAQDHLALLDRVLGDQRRAEDRARDLYRHPRETLAFFDVRPEHAVAEYAPGGGWYSRILIPYLAEKGRYVALNYDAYGDVPERYRESLMRFSEEFPRKASEQTGVSAEKISAHLTRQAPESLDGWLDRVLIIRMMHNLKRWGIADSELARIRKLLKPDGMVGIVQHWAPEGMAYEMTDGSRGYLKKSDVVALMRLHGFELVGESFINANPRDTADHPSGVWTLPPVLARGEENRDHYLAIGESNRMTLLFRKAR